MKTIRVTLDITLRPLTEDELAECGIDDLPEDCQPTGGAEDLDEVTPSSLADMAAFAIESADDLWGGSSLYAAIESVAAVDGKELN